MIIDSQLQLSAKQAVTVTAVSANVLDVGPALNVLYTPGMTVNFAVRETVLASGAATVNFQVIASTSSDMSGALQILGSGAIPKADLVQGKTLSVRIPETSKGTNPQAMRYLAVRYVVNTGPLTAGTFDAWLSPEGGTQENVALPDSPRQKQ